MNFKIDVLLLFYFILNTHCPEYIVDGILQAGAPSGTCKSVPAPNTGPLSSNSGSFTGSVQFTKSSASTVLSPSLLVLWLFHLPLLAFLKTTSNTDLIGF